MRSIILTLLVQLLSFSVYCQDENAVYERVVKDYVLKLRPPNIDYTLKTTITVIDTPASIDSLNISDYKRFKQKCNRLDKQTFLDFVSKSRENVHFENVNIDKIEFVVFTKDSVPKYEELILQYPHWVFSILEFSNIGFNDENNQALIYYSFNSGAGVGGGFYLVYEKKRKKWKQKGFIPAWAS